MSNPQLPIDAPEDAVQQDGVQDDTHLLAGHKIGFDQTHRGRGRGELIPFNNQPTAPMRHPDQ